MKVYTFFNCKWLKWLGSDCIIIPLFRLGLFRQSPMEVWHNNKGLLAVNFTLRMSFIGEFGIKAYRQNLKMINETISQKDNTDGMIQNWWVNIVVNGIVPVYKPTNIKEEDVVVSEPFYKVKEKKSCE